MKKIIVIIGLLVLISVLVSACGPKATPTTEEPAVMRECLEPDTPLLMPTGEFCVAGVDYHLTDTSRFETFTPTQGDKREVFVRVFMPSDSTMNGKPMPYISQMYAKENPENFTFILAL